MKKVTAHVTYSTEKTETTCYIYSLDIHTNSDNVLNLYHVGENHKNALMFDDMNCAYKYILDTLKENGYHVSYYPNFGRYWYDILWTDYNHPVSIHKYSYHSDYYKKGKR